MILIYGYAVRELGGKITGGVATYISVLLEGLKDTEVGLLAENVGFFKKNLKRNRLWTSEQNLVFERNTIFKKPSGPTLSGFGIPA